VTSARNLLGKNAFHPCCYNMSSRTFLFQNGDWTLLVLIILQAGQVFILIATDYFTKWVEVVPLKHSTNDQVIYFLENNIFSRFGLPLEIITDNGPAFISAKLTQFLAKLGVILPHHLITPKEMGRSSLPTRIW
jgi:hypothetical protein